MRDVSSLVETIRCPRCERNNGRLEVEAFRGICQCYRRECDGQRWWVMWLHAGDVEAQLVEVFGAELAHVNMATWKLPAQIETGRYWQISLSRRMYEAHGGSGSATLVSMTAALFRSRSSIVGQDN